jgi:hypothetical protein
LKITTLAAAAACAATVLGPGAVRAQGVTYDATLVSPSTTSTDPGYYNGSGNSSSHFTVDTENGIELGLGTVLRHIGPVTPTPTTGNVYDVPTGTAGGTATWNFEFSIDLRPSGVGALNLSDVTASLSLHDLGNGSTGSFDPLTLPDNAGWGPAGENTATGANLATDWGAQNSENLSFAGIAFVLNDALFDPNANDTYDFTLTLSNEAGQQLGSVSEEVVAGTGAPVPEPPTWAILGIGIVMLAGFGSYRHNRHA